MEQFAREGFLQSVSLNSRAGNQRNTGDGLAGAQLTSGFLHENLKRVAGLKSSETRRKLGICHWVEDMLVVHMVSWTS